MAATKKFVWARVGAGGKNYFNDVQRLQQLLIATGDLTAKNETGTWDKATAAALQSFQERHKSIDVPVRPFVEPGDYCLLLMAYEAETLIPLRGKSGYGGVLDLHDWLVTNRIEYNKGAEKGQGNRAIFGIDGRPDYAVQTTTGALRAGPVEMDCTLYVNLMLSVYLNGRAHGVPYDASCKDFGGVSAVHCARDRYRLPLVERLTAASKGVNFFETPEQIVEALENDPGLYVLEVGGKKGGGVSHMALLAGHPLFRVYECTIGQKGPSCIDRPLAAFMENKRGTPLYLFGPSP